MVGRGMGKAQAQASRKACIEKPPPRWGGVCVGVLPWPSRGEKPPPKWGVLCHGTNGIRLRRRNTPTGVGMAPTLTVDSYAHLETPPPKWGGVCELQTCYNALTIAEEKPPPEWGGVCEAPGFNRMVGEANLSISGEEKPPPKWVHRHLPPNCQGSCHHYSTQL